MKYVHNFYSRSQNLRKATVSLCLSVRPSARNSSSPSGRIFMKFDVCMFLRKPADKIKISLTYDDNIG